MQKIVPCLWFENNALEAAKFYTSIFKNSKIGAITRYDKASSQVSGQKEGSVLTVAFELEGQEFMGLNGGSVFKFTPATSFFVTCSDVKEIDFLYKKLVAGGSVLMPLQKYPFAEKYAWISDKYGLSWQLFIGESKEKIRPCLMFVGSQTGNSEKAMKFYTKIFKKSKINFIARYEKDSHGTVGHIMHATFSLEGQEFVTLDGGVIHDFTFTAAVSYMVYCKDQKEVDYFWKKLIANGGAESQCGWLVDQFGVYWQIVPTILEKLLASKKGEKVMQALLKMKKLDIKTLKEA